MAITASINLTKTPIELTVVSDKRKVAVSVTSAGETATGTATFPVTVSDDSGRVWTRKSDDGTTAIYTG